MYDLLTEKTLIMYNNDKITELKELYSTAYQLNIEMLECLNAFKHVNVVYFNAYKHFKKTNAFIFSDSVQFYVEEITAMDNGVDSLIGKIQENIRQTHEMESYLFSKHTALVN